MAYRNDLLFFEIFLGCFQDFDHGKTIPHTFPSSWNISVGDVVEWECGQFFGTAEVMSVSVIDDDCHTTLKKLS